MDTGAIKHYSYDKFCYPLNKDELQISIQTGTDITSVYLIYGDPFQAENVEGEWKWKSTRLQIESFRRLPNALLWSVTVKPEFKRCKYYFELHSAEEKKLFFEDGFYSAGQTDLQKESSPFIFPWMNEADIVTPPKWAEETVWYQIFPSRFCRAANSPALPDLVPWAPSTQAVRNEEKYGGNLAGIIEKLDYLENLGINGLYLNPLNLSRSQHKYDTTDYLTIDPEFGDAETLTALVKEAHNHGMKVMLDGVFNHSGWDFFAWQDVVKNRENSKYASWYMINDFNFKPEPCDNAAKGFFYAFAFSDQMPKLNTNNPEVQEYLISICETWIKRYDIDALRLDVANELSHNFCRELRKRLQALKPDFFIVGEIWNNSQPWLRGAEFDSVINYPLRSAIYRFAAHQEKDVRFLEEELNKCLTQYTRQTERVLINQMDSHDTIRLITRSGGNKDSTLLQFSLILTLPGAACMYYGTELLLPGGEDPDCRRCMPWKELEEGKFDDELNFMRTLVHIRRNHAALRSDSFSFHYVPSDLNGKHRVVIMQRFDEKSGETIDCFFNFGRFPFPLKGDFSIKNGEILLSRNLEDNTNLLPGGFLLIKR
ncbi:glycoside hydrolase family 13 protein [uncultured Treponema sp.]|uniref:glycoside hydrolase family 13 protein n=1 Tax=uncultured Treponema sp. TaxID=162155 RepID=UPI0025FB8676|nr:glycoside hydrolase family 13 protein [uncultured Treponema sp.]